MAMMASATGPSDEHEHEHLQDDDSILGDDLIEADEGVLNPQS